LLLLGPVFLAIRRAFVAEFAPLPALCAAPKRYNTPRVHEGGGKMLLSTLESIPGKEIQEVLGVVSGSTIRARWLGKDIVAALRTLVGGEIKEYTEMLAAARKIALERMVEEARKLGADAVLGVRLATSMVMSGAAEIIAYGTAVRLRNP